MLLSRRSAVHIFLIASSMLGILFGMPSVTKAIEAGPDWMNGQVTVTKVSDHEWIDGDQYTYGNIPCESVTGATWGWQTNGWFSWKVKTTQKTCATTGASVYTRGSSLLPFGGEYWQALNVEWDYYNPRLYPNPGTNGMALMTNAYRPYGNIPTELYYTHNVLETFHDFSQDGDGNIIRSPSKPFEHKLTYPDGQTFDLHNAYGLSYSANGRWLYVDVADRAQLRINTSDFSVTSFAPGQDSSYSLYTAVSNSGSTIAVYEYGRGLKLYDLTQCEAERPDYASRDCASRDITQLVTDGIKSIVPDLSPQYTSWSVTEVKFITESQLRLLVSYFSNNEYKHMFVNLSIDPGQTTTRYLALGDSFSSGEGAYDYRSVTNFYADDNNYNLCHQSLSSYSYLLKKSLSPEWFGSVACSGAVQRDVSDADSLSYLAKYPQAQTPENNRTEAYVNIVQQNIFPGYIPQSSFISRYKPTVATISIGGNDIGFGDIVTACIVNKFFRNMQSCSTNRFDKEQVANSIDAQISKLAATLSSIKHNMAGEQKLYVIGYPKIVNYTNMLCSLNTPMDQNEREFADNLVDYLNEAIRIAASQAGAKFLDMSSAFVNSDYDYRLCSNDEQKAVIGLSTERNSKRKPSDLVAHESFHPNKFGHSLLAQQIRLLTNDFSLKMPEATKISSVPDTAFRTRLVGDAIVTNTNQTVNYITDSIPSLIVNAGVQTLRIVANVPGVIVHNVTATVELHSTPVTIGQATVTTGNIINGTFAIPQTTFPGYHQLHIIYTDSAGQEYDLYKYVQVVASADDFDGDGVKNDDEACVIGDGSGVDSDKDGIDDACDGEYVAVKEDKNAAASGLSSSANTNETLERPKLSKEDTSLSSAETVFEDYIFSADKENHQNINDGLDKIAFLTPARTQSIKNMSSGYLLKAIGIIAMILAVVYLCFMMVKKFKRN